MCKKCKKCGTKRGLTEHHIVPKMYSKYMWSTDPNTKSKILETVTLCRKCHDEYEEFANELKHRLNVYFNLSHNGADKYIIDKELLEIRRKAELFLKKDTPKTLKETIREFFRKLLNMINVGKNTIKKFKDIVYKFPNPTYNKTEEVMRRVNIYGFINMWNNDFYNWANI